jgi:hypothetical protein
MVRACVAFACGLNAVPGFESTSKQRPELVREHEAARSAADDQNIRFHESAIMIKR